MHYHNKIIIALYTHVGIHLSLKGVVYANNSVIPITEIGRTTTNATLQCITDSIFYCPKWLLPNQTMVQGLKDGSFISFYTNQSTDGIAMLNRANDAVMDPAGLFCCRESVDASKNNQEICVNIGEH